MARLLGEIAVRLPLGSLTVLTPVVGARGDGRIVVLTPPETFWTSRVRGFLRQFSASLARLVVYLPTVISTIRSERIEVLQCGHLQLGLPAWIASRWTGVPYILYAYGDEILPKPGRFRGRLGNWLTRWILGRAAAVMTISEYTRGLLHAHGTPDKKIFKIPVGASGKIKVTPERQTEVFHDLGVVGRPILLSVGRLIPQKGHDTLLRTLPRILEEYPSACCVIVGQGPGQKELHRLAREIGVEHHARILGFVGERELASLYAGCDLFVLLSRDLRSERKVEGFGLVFLEAGAHGKPVVGGATGGVPDAIVHGVTGLLVDPEDPEGAAETMLSMLRDPDHALRMGEAGRDRVEREMNWDRCVAQVIGVLRRVTPSLRRVSDP